ncbi:hypothetical protein [Oryzihumus leptocrescens]|uniref:Secreted protein n=1 Tax=Oryzihumus leptocrescens TaxID=297536 RepID=A0A542ZHX7_9MICO|nr:hypothetical protein [Oryzihumus leptocrescens]TQL59973.1 hypothetical protein FB474_1348 [Oryzihumus leptocrescens]
MTKTSLIAKVAAGAATATLGGLLLAAPAGAMPPPDPPDHPRGVVFITRTVEVPEQGVQPGQVALGALGGIAVAGAVTTIAVSARSHRFHLPHAV